jgi:hypothetical protein
MLNLFRHPEIMNIGSEQFGQCVGSEFVDCPSSSQKSLPQPVQRFTSLVISL